VYGGTATPIATATPSAEAEPVAIL
jgi:hypothetical protein